MAIGDSVAPSEAGRAKATRIWWGLLQPVVSSGVELVVTHGGRPGEGALGQAEALDAVDDELARGLRDHLTDTRSVAALTTPVRVDPVFRPPSRAVGPRVDADAAARLRREGQVVTFDVEANGYRRLEPRTEPLEVLDGARLRRLLEAGAVVVSGGGGGAPVVQEGDGWREAEATVDPDLTAALLADAIDADQLFIVTDVSNVFEGFGTPHEAPIGLISAEELRNLLAEGHFGAETMAPKVEACVRFVSRPGRRAVICDASSLERAMAGLAGTRVIWTSTREQPRGWEQPQVA